MQHRNRIEKFTALSAFLVLGLLTALHLHFVGKNFDRDCFLNAMRTTPSELGQFDMIYLHIQPGTIWAHDNIRNNCNSGFEGNISTIQLANSMRVSYAFSREKAFLLMRNGLKSSHNISDVVADIPISCQCFGSPPMAWAIHNIVGYDTIALNLMGRIFNEHGHLLKIRSGQVFAIQKYMSLRYTPSSDIFNRQTNSVGALQEQIAYKLGLCVTIIFLFFTTTTMVSFILKQTQSKMLKFTFLLQYYVHHNIPLTFLVFTHVLESLVFVPIMIGILFFMFEFYGDQLLAFMILSLVWLCEVYSSMR